MADEMVFDDLAPREVPVRIGPDRYILREASEWAACRWRDVAIKAARMQDGKVVGVEGLAEGEPLLVSLCLCKTSADGAVMTNRNGDPVTVPLHVVQGWPARVVKALFERIKEISDLNEEAAGEEEKKAKNSPAGTEATSTSPASLANHSTP